MVDNNGRWVLKPEDWEKIWVNDLYIDHGTFCVFAIAMLIMAASPLIMVIAAILGTYCA